MYSPKQIVLIENIRFIRKDLILKESEMCCFIELKINEVCF